jgi:hypothetical protein
MRRQWILAVAGAIGVAALLAGCGSDGNKPKSPSAAVSTPRPTQAAAPSGTRGGSNTAGPAPTLAAAPATPLATNQAGCAQFAYTPVQPQGTPPPRPPVSLSQLDVSNNLVTQVLPAFQPLQPDTAPNSTSTQLLGATLTAADVAQTAADPQQAFAYLNQIGFLGGSQRGWAAPVNQGRIPTIYVQHFVFGNDFGAESFLRNPVIGKTVCAHPEPGSQIGQSTAHFFYTFDVPLQGGGTGPADGHGVFWRCGRVVNGVTGAGVPGQVTRAQIEQIAQRTQQTFVQNSQQPCS